MLVVLHENAELLRERRRAPVETIPPCVSPRFVRGVCSTLPPSSVFVLIMSAEATQTAAEGREDVRDGAAVFSEQPPGVQIPLPHPDCAGVYFKQSYMNFPAVVKPACGPAGSLCAGDSFTDFSISAGLLWE